MSRSRVVRNDVHYDLKVLLVSLLNIGSEKVIVTEARIYMIIIGAGIAVVSDPRKIIFDQRSTPYGSSTEFTDIVEMVDYTLDIAAVTTERQIARHLIGHSLDRVIGRIAV
jgi:hypothetical protein